MITSKKKVNIYRGYKNAITNCDSSLIYISLPNSMHATWANHALDAGKHVIIDKPATMNLEEAKNLLKKAKQKKLCVAEANVWMYHPMTRKIKKIIDREKGKKQHISAVFTSPPLNPENYRYKKAYGGGILLDRGSYAASCSRIFIEKSPKEVHCHIIKCNKKDIIDISFSISMLYEDGIVFSGFFSLAAEYVNRLSIHGSTYYLDAGRIFTPPADFNGNINLIKNNKKNSICVEAADTFSLFIKDVISAINKKSYSQFAKILFGDTKLLSDIINVATKVN